MAQGSPRGPDPEEDDLPEPPRLRALRRLVTALTAALILGVLTVAATLVIRIAGGGAAPELGPVAAEAGILPAGEAITATGAAGDALLFVTRDRAGVERLRIFDAGTGEERSAVRVSRER